MNRVTMTPEVLRAHRAHADVTLRFSEWDQGWYVDIWVPNPDFEGSRSGYHLASTREPTATRIFKTLDAAVRVLKACELDAAQVEVTVISCTPPGPVDEAAIWE